MKKTFLFSLIVLGLTSCSKDSLDQNVDSFQKPVKSEIMVQVSYLNWANTCGTAGNEEIHFMANINVELFHGDQNQTAGDGVPMMNTITDSKGTAMLENIEPDTYTVSVETPLGTKSRTLTTQLHKRSYVDFSF